MTIFQCDQFGLYFLFEFIEHKIYAQNITLKELDKN